MEGWIKAHRQIMEHWLWSDKPFSKGQAFIDLLFRANHNDKTIVFNGSLINIKRGTFITSELKLMENWGWSKSKVRYFLNLLEFDQMIVKKTDNKKTTISILNYETYQGLETTEEPKKDFKKTAERPQKDTNKNEKNEKNNKNTYGEFQNVFLTDSEYNKLLNDGLLTEIERLSEYIASKGAQYKNHYATIRMWKSRDIKNENTKRTNGIRSTAIAQPSPREAFTEENCKFN